MNSVYDKFQKRQLNIIEAYNLVRQNPSNIGKMLFDAGKIDRTQLEQINSMQNPKQIVDYLLQNNTDFQRMYRGK